MSIVSIASLGHSHVKAFTVAAALAGAVLAWPQASVARRHEGGAFARFAGEWRGAGQVVSTGGGAEAINCRARGDVSEGGESFAEALVCASASSRFDIRINAVAAGESVTGTWQETTRGAGGSLSGQIANGAFEGSVQGSGFTASVSYRSNGRTQTIVINPNNAGGIARVEATLRRGG
jgi:hypothetical protein